MAYTINKTDGTLLTTIADGTINTAATPLALPGRNFAGYGQYVDTDFVHALENFAFNAPPPNALKGQLWYDTNINGLRVCPADGETNPLAWVQIAQAGGNITTNFGNVTIVNNFTANSGTVNVFNVLNTFNANNAVMGNTTIQNLNVTGNSYFNNINSNTITAGNTGNGAIYGNWTFQGNSLTANVNFFEVTGSAQFDSDVSVFGNLTVSRDIFANNSTLYISSIEFTSSNGGGGGSANLNTINISNGSYIYAAGAGSYIVVNDLRTSNAATPTVPGTLSGNWNLSTGSQLTATYADLAERFAADDIYDSGTVVELGGDFEITAVKTDASSKVFGVISNCAAYVMNGAAGTDETHPKVAMTGRVPVKVKGAVRKGDRLVAAGEGHARSARDEEATAFNSIGRALEDKLDSEPGRVLAIVTIK